MVDDNDEWWKHPAHDVWETGNEPDFLRDGKPLAMANVWHWTLVALVLFNAAVWVLLIRWAILHWWPR